MSDRTHEVVFFRRHRDDDPAESSPGYEFLEQCPTKVQATIYSVLDAVASAPPKRYAGGGYWEAMHGDMSGWFEIRVDGSKPRLHYRVFCRIDHGDSGTGKPLLVVIDGRHKPRGTTLSAREYIAVRKLGGEYFSRNPRSLL